MVLFAVHHQQNYIPPQSLLEFLDKGPPPLYIGFGSLTFNCNRKMTEALLATLQKMGERAILSGSFSHVQKEHLPQHLLWVDSVPHDWGCSQK